MPRKSDAAKQAAVASELRALFKKLETRPVPDTIRSVVDQLDEGEAKPAAKRPRKRGGSSA